MLSTPKLVQNLIKLQQKYATTYRAITTEERYNNLVRSGVLRNFSYDSKLIREPLLEHVGHLPVLATALYPHLENQDKIDLGKTLTILAIHDIGEIEVGDVLSYAKTTQNQETEYEAAKKLLPIYYHQLYDDYEIRSSLEAKFAKSVDALAPFLHEMALPEVTIQRFKHFNFDPDKIEAKKKKYFAWDKTMQKIFNYCMSEFRKM